MRPISGKLKGVEQSAVAAYQRGLSLIDVGKMFGVNGRAIWGLLVRLGIPRRSTTGRQIGYCKRGHDMALLENQYLSPVGKRHCLACRNIRNRDPRTIEQKKRGNLQRNYGITLEEKEAKRLAQNNKCMICGDEFVKSPNVDHDHDTGIIRDLLCGPCNAGCGQFFHDPARLEAAATYCRRWKEIIDALSKGLAR
jgi:hypothetical protein